MAAARERAPSAAPPDCPPHNRGAAPNPPPRSFASIASFPCIQQPSDPPAAANGSAAAAAKPALRVGVMMDRMSRLLAVDKANNQISVEAQMTLKELYAAANAHGLSVPRMSLPWWQGLTLAGIHATSAHGSGNNVTSMIVRGRALGRGARSRAGARPLGLCGASSPAAIHYRRSFWPLLPAVNQCEAAGQSAQGRTWPEAASAHPLLQTS